MCWLRPKSKSPDSASGRSNRNCSDRSTEASHNTFPVHFPSFQPPVCQGLPELPVLSLNPIAPNGLVSCDLVPAIPWARAASRHLPVPAGNCRAGSITQGIGSQCNGQPGKRDQQSQHCWGQESSSITSAKRWLGSDLYWNYVIFESLPAQTIQ